MASSTASRAPHDELPTEPGIGPRMNPDESGCGFTTEVGGTICGVPPIVHLCIESAVYGLVGVASCLHHLAIARSTGVLRARHHYHPERCSTPHGHRTPDALAVPAHWTADEQANA